MLLERLGFRPPEIHYGGMASDGRFLVPAVVGGESVWLLLITAEQNDLTILLGHATKAGWPYERRTKRWGTSPLADAFALGRARPPGRVDVYGTEGEAGAIYSTAGTLGVRYVNHATLALDPVDAAVGLSEAVDLGASPPAGALRVALVEGTLDRIAVTLDLGDANARQHRPHFLVDTGRPVSVLSLDYIERAWHDSWHLGSARRACRRSAKTVVYLRPPGGERVEVEMSVVEKVAPRYGDELGTTVDGYLGLDFLYRWVPVIDFPRAALWLTPLETGA